MLQKLLPEEKELAVDCSASNTGAVKLILGASHTFNASA